MSHLPNSPPSVPGQATTFGALRDLVFLSALCALLYLPSLTEPGLANWQESQRALVAREMQARGEWLVPTVQGKPYLAKPPMIYWSQLGLAALRGVRTSETELRLTVALAGWLGVIATYLVARRMFRPWPGSDADGQSTPPTAMARWAAVLTATGFLYTHSSRMGELDILLAPLCVIAVGCLLECWRSVDATGKTHWPALAGAVAAASAAALTKGPPAILPIGIAAYGGMMLYVSCSQPLARRHYRLRWTVALVLAVAAMAAGVLMGSPAKLTDFIGIALFGGAGALLGWVLAGLADRAALARLWRLFSRTHPLLVLGLPLLVYFAWLTAAAHRIGADVVQQRFDAERADNLRLFDPGSPINNLEAAAYGAGLGSIFALAALVWIASRRIAPGPALATLLAWCVGGLIAFSMLGKGVPRYLTPLWPGMALLGAVWVVQATTHRKFAAHIRRGTIAALMMITIVLALWYGYFRQSIQGNRSPKLLVAELVSRGIRPEQLAQFDFSAPAIPYYTEFAVPSYLDTLPGTSTVNVGPQTIEDLKRQLRPGEEAVILVREPWPARTGPAPAVARLQQIGFALEPLNAQSVFLINNGVSRVMAYRARVPAPNP